MTSAAARASSARGPPAGPSRRWRSAAPPPCRSACAERRGAGPRPRRVPDCLPRNAAWCDRPSSRRLPRAATSPSPTPSSAARRICARLTLRTACLPLFTLVLAQFDTPAYVHQDFLLENYPDESKPGPLSRPSSAVLHRKAGPVSRLHSRLHGHQRKAARRSRHAAPLPGHAALRPPNGPDTRAPRPHRTTTRTSPIHPNPHRPRDAARHQINSRQTVITSVWSH